MVKETFFKRMQSNPPSLFSSKEQYQLDHTNRGKSKLIAQLSQTEQRKLTVDHMHLSVGMKFTSENEFPVLQPYNGDCNFEMCAYTNLKQSNGKDTALHFFLDDYKFCKIWDNLELITSKIQKFAYVFAPDYSLYVDAPSKQMNIQNVYRSRFIAAYWQKCGLQVIPVASWGDANSLKYCFEGLPEKSIIAVCGIGHSFCQAADILWHHAVKLLIAQKQPTRLIVYGGKYPDNLSSLLPVTYIPDHITKNFRSNENTNSCIIEGRQEAV